MVEANTALAARQDGGVSPLRWALDRLYHGRGLVFLVVLLVLWEVASRNGVLNPRLFPAVSDILVRFGELWLTNVFPGHLLATLQRMAAGYLLAALVGVGAGLVMGYWQGIYRRLELLLEFLRPMPPVALIPVFILFLGIGDEMKIALVFFGALWPILLSTVDGARGVHPTMVDVARMYHYGHGRTLMLVIFPSALPQTMAGLRVSLAVSLILALVSEMVGATRGLGQFILVSQRSFRMADMYSGIFLLAILGYTLNRLFLLAERRLMAWHLEQTGQTE